MLRMAASIGPQSSRECTELVAAFFECRRRHGLTGMVAGNCEASQRRMNECLDREVRRAGPLVHFANTVMVRRPPDGGRMRSRPGSAASSTKRSSEPFRTTRVKL